MSTIKKNSLSGCDRYKLQKWLEAQAETIQKARLTIPEVLRRASSDLQLRLTEANLSSSARAVGVKFSARINHAKTQQGDALRRHEAALLRIAKALDLDLSDLLPAPHTANGNGKPTAQGELPLA